MNIAEIIVSIEQNFEFKETMLKDQYYIYWQYNPTNMEISALSQHFHSTKQIFERYWHYYIIEIYNFIEQGRGEHDMELRFPRIFPNSVSELKNGN